MKFIKVFKENKKLARNFLVVGLFILLISVGFVFLLKNKYLKKQQNPVQPAKETDKNQILKDLKVKIVKVKNKNNTVLLSIKNIPKGTRKIEYEITYETEDKGLQGVIGSLEEFEGDSYEKEIFLGTCSSGVCVPHKVKGSLDLILRFAGDYEEVVFEGKYEI